MVDCSNCASTGWVCERHTDRAWEQCDCGGAGEPCAVCNSGPVVRAPDCDYSNREDLNALRSERMAGEPEDESVHFYVCKACGQAVGKRNLGDVFHHEEKGHEPIPSDS
jgi:hypothetical protein